MTPHRRQAHPDVTELREGRSMSYPYPPIPVERAETRPLKMVTRNPYRWRVALIVALGVVAVAISGGFLWAVITWS